MARLILTSSFNTVSRKLLHNGFLPSSANVAFIVTAGDPYQETPWIEADRKALLDLGYKVTDVDLKSGELLLAELQAAEIIFIAGGNTTYLAEQVHRAGLKGILRNLLETRLFIGSSAGSILAGPTVEPFIEEDLRELSKDFSLSNPSCLGFVDYIVLPHYPKYAAPNDAIAKKYPSLRFVKMADEEYRVEEI